MKALLEKFFGVNWSTNLPATGFALCTTAGLADMIPAKYAVYAMAFCSFMITVGLFNAKSSNVTNAAKPVEAQAVPPAVS